MRLEQPRIPWRIETSELVLRCFAPEDAPALVAAISCSIDSLREWMHWAQHEPMSVQAKAQQLARWRVEFALSRNLHYGIFIGSGECLGAIGMHARIGAGARELGYWVRADRQRQGIATKAALALTQIGFQVMSLRRMEIHCDVLNAASSGVAQRAGYQLQVTINNIVRSRRAPQVNGSVWMMQPGMYVESRAAIMALRAFDAMGGCIFSSAHA